MNKSFSSRNFFITLFLSLLSALLTSAQGENDHWHFADGWRMDFEQSPPQVSQTSQIAAWESSVAVSDSLGNLLFYTIGSRIWDKNGNEMPNAGGLLGNGPVLYGHPIGSGRESCQIIAHPTDPDRYYVFSGDADQTVPGGAFYHLVDMKLNGGLGDIVPGEKNIQILSNGSTEYTTVAYGDCNTFWFIIATNSIHNYDIYAYKIDANGVSATPVVSSLPFTGVHRPGHMVISEKYGSLYARSNLGIMRAEFNKTSGVLSNWELIPNAHGYGPIELSPNDNLLYAVGISGQTYSGPLWQYNLQLYPDLNAIGASATQISAFEATDIRSAPNGRMYCTHPEKIAEIQYPDVTGTAVGFSDVFFVLPLTTTFVGYPGLGARFLPRHAPVDTIIGATYFLDTVICSGHSITLQSPRTNMLSYRWSDGNSTAQNNLSNEGVFWVYGYTGNCEIYIDSFRIRINDLEIDLGNDTNICKGQRLILNAYHPEAVAYQWNTGSTAAQINITEAGLYHVSVSKGACTFKDTINVNITDPGFEILQRDTAICKGYILDLEAKSDLSGPIQWDPGVEGNIISVQNTGIYRAMTTNECGTQIDSVRVDVYNCDCVPAIPNAFSPNADGLNDIFIPKFKPDCMFRSYELAIFNRNGQHVFSTNVVAQGWNGSYLAGGKADLGVYYYVIKINPFIGATEPIVHTGEVSLIR